MKATTVKMLAACMLAGSSLSLFAQKTDSAAPLKNAIGISVEPATLYFWTHPGITVDTEWSSEPKRTHLTFGWPAGVSYQYRLSHFFTLIAGLQYTKESQPFFADIQTASGVSQLKIDYNVAYYKIPVGIRFYPGHFGIREDHAGGFFMQLNYSADFLAKENITTTTYNLGDPHYSHSSTTADADVQKTDSDKIRYHRITPSFMMGGSVGEKHFSFSFATQLQFFGVFQPDHITQENFKNAQFGLVLGINYRF